MALIPVPLPPWMHFEVDLSALLFNFALAVFAALLFSLAPALQLSKVDVNGSLKDGTRGSAGRRATRSLRDGLVVAEIAVSLVLLVGAGAMMRCFLYLRNSDPGIDRNHLLAVRVGRFLTGMTNDQLAMAFAADHRRLLDRAAELPGVVAVSGGDDFPYESHADERGRGEIYVLGQDEQQRKENGAVQSAEIAPGYFRVLGIPLLAGRDLPRRTTRSLYAWRLSARIRPRPSFPAARRSGNESPGVSQLRTRPGQRSLELPAIPNGTRRSDRRASRSIFRTNNSRPFRSISC